VGIIIIGGIIDRCITIRLIIDWEKIFENPRKIPGVLRF
jgi:hypothetical protein